MQNGAIFDCDGTLLDSIPAWRGLEGYLCSFCGGQVTAADRALLTTFTIPETARWFHESFGLGRSVEAVISMMDEYLIAQYAKAELLPGVPEFLEECARAGVTMSVASSSSVSYLESGLHAAGIRDLFAAVVSVEQLDTTKREPKVYDHALALMGTCKERTWGFEDSQYAAETLKRAGYKVVGISGVGDATAVDPSAMGNLAPDIVVADFTQLAPAQLWG